MKDNNVSKTAEGVAMIRALHNKYDVPVVFEDPYAAMFSGKSWNRVFSLPLIPKLLWKTLFNTYMPSNLVLLGRARYTEDLLDKAIEQGVEQYVIMGAGFDSFAFRREELKDKVQVYEVDYLGTQQEKQKRIQDNIGAIPDNLHFVDVDFESESLADGLARSSFDRNKKTFFSWLGVTPYLSQEAAKMTLDSLVSIAAPGSKLTFDYYIPTSMLSGEALILASKLIAQVEKRGEPFIGFYAHDQIGDFLAASGLKLIENLSPDEQQARYWADRQDGTKVYQQAWLAYAGIE